MPKHTCPYCEADASSLHAAVSEAHAKLMAEAGKGVADVGVILCVECGEPIALHHGVLRKPTHEELEQMLTDMDYQKMRATWMEFEERRKLGDGPPARAMWERYVKGLDLTFPNRNIENRVQDIFLSGVAMSLQYFNDAMNEDDHVFLGRMQLLETELTQRAKKRMQAEKQDKFEQLGDILQRVIDALASKGARKPT